MELQKWKEKNAKARKYAHFDEKVSLDKVWDYISNPENIVRHGFYPFIHYEKKFNKFTKTAGVGKVKEKSRHLCYSAHVDRYIYSYYGYLLNQKYDKYLAEHDMNMVAVAYRDNLHKSNIHFAKAAFDCIREAKDCFVIIGDFSNFFDSLDHVYLKGRMCDVLGVKELPADYYAVFKNITKYSIWELTELLKLNGQADTEENIQNLNSKRRVLSAKKFKKYKKEFVIKHKESYGIPQGSAISAVLANIYMLKIDESMHKLVRKSNGLYMRYSDDFIIVLPQLSNNEFKMMLEDILDEIKLVPNLILQPEKTQIYKYTSTKLESCNAMFLDGVANGKNEIDYLGFTFDGNEVTIRDKTISKYYYRLHRKLKTIVKNGGYTSSGKKISCKNLYEQYSVKGAYLKDSNGHVKGNFITYVQRAQNVFGDDEPIDRKTRKHMIKIRRVLDEIF
ncbi:antiviral reverse transcriptase Drt2 [Laedolimicola sp.]|uniref:antiviral reverse transcriptase Drt2 n=1 Tax=Laedolimicola sp. TaxID=2981663 RepID=UPI003F7F8A91